MDPFTIVYMVAVLVISLQQQQAQQRRMQKQQAEAANRQAKQQWEEQQREEKQRKDKLRVDLAKKRAKMGAAGFSASDGSAGAIIQGMRNDASEDISQSYESTKKLVDNSLSSIQSGLLEKSDKNNREMYKNAGQELVSIGGSLLEKNEDSQNSTSSGAKQASSNGSSVLMLPEKN